MTVRVPVVRFRTQLPKKPDFPKINGGRNKMWSRKKKFVLYLLSMPFLSALFVYYSMHEHETVGTISLLIGAIILFAEVENYLREILARKRGH
jgi:hypothetical protein